MPGRCQKGFNTYTTISIPDSGYKTVTKHYGFCIFFRNKLDTPYDGDSSFLAGPTEATDKLWGILQGLQKEERAKGGVLDMDTDIVSGITSHGPGYISEENKDLEQIVGLQTDKPLKRVFMPYGGIRMAEEACKNYGYEPSPELHKIFTEYCRTHNQGVFDA